MVTESTAFEKTYNDYIAQVTKIDFQTIEQKLGVRSKSEVVVIPLLGKPYRVSEKGITGPSGKRPFLNICVILSKYLLLCPKNTPKDKDWVSFRDLKDSGPLTSYFANDVERPIAKHFSKRVNDLMSASKKLGGYPPDVEFPYDLTMQFDLLPKIPVLMLYNDADAEFPAKCSALFERCAESYLDAECLAMAGNFLFTSLKREGP